ncbi:tetratricopeptide repeat protein [Erythrobacter rubeus]|uniref:Adenylate cyclase n=1 Tax=Erythrobacter rubeus TaxID=2760803 RepID=A0ABR8KN16_9SPHN|nr:hypothetical protein [Erythrobacter rubeus]MBD2840637.1 hypothetical protein [Erythrobacter rubeus]
MVTQQEQSLMNFNHQLTLEAERVLGDVIFQRAPIQSQLLRFLVAKALAGGAPPTQYEIAVDGLGKDEDYDVEADSYPRVQISRLRRSLENYYARNLPGNGLGLQLDSGSYGLTLAAVEATPNTNLNRDAESEPVAEARQNAALPMRLVGAAALGLVGLVTTLLMIMGGSAPIESGGPEKPSTALILDSDEELAGLGLPQGLTDTARQIAEIQLAGSFVSKPLAHVADTGDADYFLTLNFGPGTKADIAAQIALADVEGEILYLNSIPFNPLAPEDFETELEASLVYMTSPTGAIAQAELPRRSDHTSSDYACFLAIENRRSNGDTTAKMVDDCLDRYPNSSYRAFWYARRAFARYQNAVIDGRPIEKSGQGWSDLRKALEADRYNAFANFSAAKIELANGDCDEARGYVNRALERGGSYPALIAAIETNAAACAASPSEARAFASRIRTLARFNPDPDPLLHLYLVAGLLAANDRETAEIISRRATIENPEGLIEETSDLLRRSLEDPDFAKSNREELAQAIYLFLWNKRTTQNVLKTLLV